jgi:hypothetical protein
MESIVETKASSILQFIHGLRGELHVTWEEGTWAAWLYDVLQPKVTRVLVCDPRRNALLKEGNKSDKIDARKQVCPDFCVKRPGFVFGDGALGKGAFPWTEPQN